VRSPVHESTLPPILGVDEMAALLGMSVATLYRAMKRPEWSFPELARLDHHHRWSRDQVLATLAAVQAYPARRRA